MARPEDFPEILIPRPEGAAMLVGAAVAAGEILGERIADGYVQVEINNGSLAHSTEQHVIVHGRAQTDGPHMSASVRAWPWTGRGAVGTTSIVYAGERQHNTRTWLNRVERGELRRVTSQDVNGRGAAIVGSEPATLGTVNDMLAEVRESSARLPDDRPALAPRGYWQDDELFVVHSERLVPVVAGLVRAVGGALLVPSSEGRTVDVALNVEVASVGRVYGYGGQHAGEQRVALDVVDRKTRKGVGFGLKYKFSNMIGDEPEYCIAEGHLRTEDRTGDTRVVTREIIGQRGTRLWVSRRRQVNGGPIENLEGYRPADDIITTMAAQAVEAATAPPAS